jgi:hypothetical protein
MISRRTGLKTLAAGAVLALSFGQALAATADVSGYKFDDTAKVAGKDLKLNGAGMRTKFVVKVYAAGLYMPEKKSVVADILKQEGPRRVTLQMARDLSSEDFGKAFMEGLNDNVDRSEKRKSCPRSASSARCSPWSKVSRRTTCCTSTGFPVPAPYAS